MSGCSKIIRLNCVVPNTKGLHARAAAQIVTLASQYPCDITLAHKEKSVPSLSLIKLLTLDAPQGSTIVIQATGEQAKDAAMAMERLINDGFGE